MILIAQILIALFFLYNMGKLMYDYMSDEKEVNFINMVLVIVSIGALLLLNFVIGW